MREVVKRMREQGFASHSLDLMCFLAYSSDGLWAVVVFHVDDALIIWRDDFPIKGLRSAFEWGSWIELPDKIVWVGREVNLVNDKVVINQTSYTKELREGRVSKKDRDEPRPLIPSEVTEFKSCIGSLQYLSSNSRPDLAAGTSLVQGSGVTTANLHAAYEHIQYAKATADTGIVVNPVDLDSAMIVGYGDSSWANAEGLRSQTGKIVVLTDSRALKEKTPGTVVDWRSTRTKRVVRSTLAAEAIAADAATDHSYYMAAFFDEGLHRRRATSGKPVMKTIICTDCRSLYDAVKKVQGSLEEKRTMIDLLSIKEHVGDDGLRWVPTTEMHADPLTKIDRQLLEKGTEYLANPYVMLRSPDG